MVTCVIFCSVTLGGWTLIYRTILQTADKIYSFTTADNYRNISNYKNTQIIPVTVLYQLRQDMGFNQIRFYCFKRKIGKVIHIMTKDSPEGEKVIRFFTNSTTKPASCGSFTVLPDDNSTLSQQCSNWGMSGQGAVDGKWSTYRSKTTKKRLCSEPVLLRSSTKFSITFAPTFNLLYCDDHWDYGIKHSVGDTWLIFVR